MKDIGINTCKVHTPIIIVALIALISFTGVFPFLPQPADAEEGASLTGWNTLQETDYYGADALVIGIVVEKASYWNDEHTGIFTSVDLLVDETLKGDIGRDTITITYAGGVADGMGQWVSDMPYFAPAEKAAVFLQELPKAQVIESASPIAHTTGEHFTVYGGYKGKFSIVDNKIGNLTVTDFKNRLNRDIEGAFLSSEEGAAPPSEVSLPYLYQGIRWPHPPDPVIDYRINENTADCTGEGAAVQAAAAAWSAAGARFSFNYIGATTAVKGYNGFNDISWTQLGSGALGMATVWYDPGTLTILECDMEFNDLYAWSTAAVPPGGQYDVQSIALHEFGHFLMLGDLYAPADAAKVMYGYGSAGSAKRNLHADDITGIRDIYGIPADPPAVTNNGAGNVTPASARLNGEVTSTGGENPSVSIYWGSSDGATAPENWGYVTDFGAIGAGAFYLDVSGLSSGTTYYYRCYAVNSAGATWAPATANFTTPWTLTIGVSGNGTTEPAAGSHYYDPGTLVGIDAAAAANWAFVNWAGDNGTIVDTVSPYTSITMNDDYSINATFVRTHGTLTMITSGSGTVSLSPIADNNIYALGSNVTITAAPAAGWRFVSWTGDVGTVDNITAASTNVTINDDYTVTANFDQPILTIDVNGSGTTDPAVGSYDYDVNTIVSVNAAPAANWEFIYWTGDVSNNSTATTNVTMDTDKLVIANFTRTHGMLTMLTTGNGTVSLSPIAGYNTYTVGATVNITATTDAGWMFVNWTGDTNTVDNVTAASTNLTINDDYTITANFDRPTLTMAVNGNGNVTPNIGSHDYNVGANVAITAAPASGYYFVNWTGDTGAIANVTASSTAIIMDGDYNITANFAVTQQNPPVGGGGGGGGGGSASSTSYGDKTTTGLRGGISEDGRLMEDIQAISFSTFATLDLPYHSYAKDKGGNALTAIRITELAAPNTPQDGASIVGFVYELGPDGANFDPPITLTIHYLEKDLPAGITEDMLCIAIWDEASGTYMPVGFTIDTEKNEIYASISHFSQYTILAEPQPAQFVLSELTISPADVNPGGSIDVGVTISNNGDLSGNYTCNVMINDAVFASEDVTLDGNTQTTLTSTIPANEAGTYSVNIGGLTGTYTVSLSPASFKIGSLSISRDEIEIGQAVDISVIVSNTGQAEGIYEVTLKANETVVNTKDVSLSGGASETVLFTFTADKAGQVLIEVNGLSGEFTVKAKTTPVPAQETQPSAQGEPAPSSGNGWILWIPIIFGCPVIAGCILYFTWWRKRTPTPDKPAS